MVQNCVNSCSENKIWLKYCSFVFNNAKNDNKSPINLSNLANNVHGGVLLLSSPCRALDWDHKDERSGVIVVC